MRDRLILILLLNSIVLMFALNLWGDEVKIYAFVTGQILFLVSLLTQVFLVNRMTVAKHKSRSPAVVMGAAMVVKFGFFGLAMWFFFARLHWSPFHLLFGLISGLAIFGLSFYSFSSQKLKSIP